MAGAGSPRTLKSLQIPSYAPYGFTGQDLCFFKPFIRPENRNHDAFGGAAKA